MNNINHSYMMILIVKICLDIWGIANIKKLFIQLNSR